ncbi:reverse transcriptase/maturase family protein [Streptomyces sp. NBC_00075]|uniref:reverse transcriptase/maturase family protein n=1 Tax=Streptomyces sp. NBC_00075 TaxID=2975641 RepID=UPI003246B434
MGLGARPSLLLEAYYEPRFSARSHGFRPGRGCHTALDEIASTWTGTTWFIEGDIKTCFDNVDHHVLMGLVAERIKDRKIPQLVSAFLRAGVVELHGGFAETLTGTPQGGVASPLLANIYLSVLDRHFSRIWDTEMSPLRRRAKRS